MKIVVIGGTGLIGSPLVNMLQQRGHEALAASPSKGVNAVTGEGLAAALAGADVVVDVANSPSFDDEPVMNFFEASTRNLLAAEAAAGVKNHVALSVVGTERLPSSGYFRAKMKQETLIKAGPIPYTIVRATQFFEFVASISYSGGNGPVVHLPTALMQPIAAGDVSTALAEIAVQPPVNGMVEIGGPEKFKMFEIVRRALEASGDGREVVGDPNATYFGAPLDDKSLVADDGSLLGPTRYEEWLSRGAAAK
ncbi:MAG: NmrA family transcriptional regulator [Pirellula sp.]|nr:NmrA family transcriptional regulator [Pirellula sp.]